jgi:phosphoenolpyruvate carboxykinase (ATP)
MNAFNLQKIGLRVVTIHRNLPPARLYEEALRYDKGSALTASGALVALSGEKTGRSPRDKRIVREAKTEHDIWWGEVNSPLDGANFFTLKEQVLANLNTLPRLYVVDAFAGWSPKERIKIRIICSRPYHALFMHNMLIRPTSEELKNFGEPDFTIYNAGTFAADTSIPQISSKTSVSLNFASREFLILGTEYAGEMKKGVFTILNYLAPKKGALSMHCSANAGIYNPLKPGSKNAQAHSGSSFTKGTSANSPTRPGSSIPGSGSAQASYSSSIAGSGSAHSSPSPSGVGDNDDVALFFGLSGTGKTTLSAEPDRMLIGDDEHVWNDEGISNIEGGCYAKCVNLSKENEPMIHQAIRFGSLLENVVIDPLTSEPDYTNISLTENTRCSYPIEFINNAKIPCVGGHPKNIVFLTADAFGVLPPVAKLTPEQAMYHFISGYTAKVAGTEMGVKEPQATFSACFGAAFMVWHPSKYAEILSEKIKKHGCQVWLVNTGWTSGSYGVGKRISLKDTRAIISGIHSAEISKAGFETLDRLKLQIPKAIPGVDPKILRPRDSWKNKVEYDQTVEKLIGLFKKNYEKFSDRSSTQIEAGALSL